MLTHANSIQQDLWSGSESALRAAGLHGVDLTFSGILEKRIAGLEPLRKTTEQIGSLESRIARLEPRSDQIGELNKRIRDLESRHEASIREKNTEIERLRQFSRDVEPILAESEKRESRVRALELQYETLLGQRRSELSPRRPATTPKARVSESGKVAKDDLKRIYGIGPVLERTLNRLGIYKYEQIASWTEVDIERVSKQVGTFPDRIHRDSWVGGARKQHRSKYGEEA